MNRISWDLTILRGALFLASLAVMTLGQYAHAESVLGPVKRVEIYVTPYYRSAATSDGAPTVRVVKAYNTLLASNHKEDILSVERAIEARPQLITPMTLMVLAIRLYDVGERDRAVFWFYVAKDRYITLADVVDINGPGLNGIEDAVKSFAILAGPYFNSYAFCNPSKQHDQMLAAINWVEKNPYQAIYSPQLSALPGDRAENLNRSIDKLRATAAQEYAQINNPAQLELMRKARKAKHVDEQFCWSVADSVVAH